jgi:type II secretory pathway component GspD/PulD (secretin)
MRAHLRRSALLAAALGAALLPAGARAEDAPPAPPAGPVVEPPAVPPIPKPDAPAETRADDIRVDEDRIEAPDGWTTWYYAVNFVDPKVLQGELQQWKTKDAKIEPMAQAYEALIVGQDVPARSQPGNVLRIRERRENLPLLQKLVELLDRPQPQVLVRAKLVEITYSGGLEWGFEAAYTAPGATFFRGTTAVFNPESYLSATTARPFQGGTFNFAFVGDSALNYGNLNEAIRLLKSRGKAEILGEPNILATQGVKAVINAGEEIPIQTAFVSGNAVTTSIAFRRTGITLEITPELIGRDAVRMRLKETVAAVSGFVTGQGGVQNPVFNDRSAETTLTVRDGATLVVGGLQSSRLIENESGIPLLMDIPLLGWLFSTRSKDEVQTELYFIATPEIIRGSYGEGMLQPPGELERLKTLKR